MTIRITNFNNYCNDTEVFLSKISVVPILGAAFAAYKFIFGTIQAITALALGILSSPFRSCSDDAKAFNDHCWSHVIHGLGNMVAGLGEALLSITIIGGFIFLGMRHSGHCNNNPYHQDKYIPYSDLIARDIAALPLDYQQYDAFSTIAPAKGISPTAFRNAIGVNVVPVR